MRLGFIGTGTITAAVVTGLGAAADPPAEIWLSPRSAQRARALAAAHANVHVAATNQEVLDRSDTVLLAVLPQIAGSVLKDLVFCDSHRCISLIAGYSRELLLSLIRPATRCVRATPTPSAARRAGPISIYPPDPDAVALFSRIGDPVAVEDEQAFNALLSCSAEMCSFFGWLQGCERFMTAHGVSDAAARTYASSLFAALGQTALARDDLTLEALAHQHATPGGINEQMARELREWGVFDAQARGLERIFTRVCAATWKAAPGQSP